MIDRTAFYRSWSGTGKGRNGRSLPGIPTSSGGLSSSFSGAAALFAGTFAHLGSDDEDHLVIEALSTVALTTSEIEGEVLDRASVQSSIRQQLGLATERRRVTPTEQGVSEMTVHLYRSFGEPLADGMLFEGTACC